MHIALRTWRVSIQSSLAIIIKVTMMMVIKVSQGRNKEEHQK